MNFKNKFRYTISDNGDINFFELKLFSLLPLNITNLSNNLYSNTKVNIYFADEKYLFSLVKFLSEFISLEQIDFLDLTINNKLSISNIETIINSIPASDESKYFIGAEYVEHFDGIVIGKTEDGFGNTFMVFPKSEWTSIEEAKGKLAPSTKVYELKEGLKIAHKYHMWGLSRCNLEWLNDYHALLRDWVLKETFRKEFSFSKRL